VTRGFMGPLGGFWPKLGRKRVTGWKQRSCVPPGRVKTNKQTNLIMDMIECVVDKVGDLEDPNNLYTCKSDQTCCHTNLQPACCSTKPIAETM
jgi:hypothetical protein